MIVLHVRLRIRPGMDADLADRFRTNYSPAIRVQKGFRVGRLLRLSNSEGNDEYIISISFDSEEQRLAWVATPEHKQSWAEIETLCSTVSDEGLNVVADI